MIKKLGRKLTWKKGFLPDLYFLQNKTTCKYAVIPVILFLAKVTYIYIP
jgi:hypothetical protein